MTKVKLVQHHSTYTSDWNDLLQCLRNNTTVQYVLLERHFVRTLLKSQWIAVLQAVGQMTALEQVELWSVRVPLQALQLPKNLTRLGFGFVTLEGSLDASALRFHPSLKSIYLSDFRFAEEAASLDSLCCALSTCPKLELIEVFQYQQERPPFSAKGLATLMESPSLRHLTLRRTGLTAELTQDLAQKLSTNETLRVLNLNENNLGNEGCVAVGDALRTNNTLQELDLRKNQLTSKGCFRLTQRLTHNTGLQRLNLACNPLEDLGAQGLARLLSVHPSLKTLELHRTQLTDVGCISLITTLRHNNNTLLHLDLSFNNAMTEVTYLQVADALKNDNTTLKSINRQVNRKMKLTACQALLTLVQENTSIESISTLLRVRFEPHDKDHTESVLNQINLYLKLNQNGRRQRLLQRTASRDEWTSALLSMQDDLNGLYYLLQANPTVLQYCCADGDSLM